MTTIAYDGKSLCADTLITVGGERVGYRNKLVRKGDFVFAYCGDVSVGLAVGHWLLDGAKAKLRPEIPADGEFEIVLVSPREVLVCTEDLLPYSWYGSYAAGSGASFARAAMAMGAAAKEAVLLAMKLDCYSGGEVTEERVR